MSTDSNQAQLFQQRDAACVHKPEGFVKVAGVPRVGDVAVAAFGDEVGEFEDFVRVFAEHFFQFGKVVVIHGDDEVEFIEIFGTHFAAGKTLMVDAVGGEGFARALVHVFAVVPAGCACAVGADAVGYACFAGAVAQDVFRHGGAADVAEADEEYGMVFHRQFRRVRRRMGCVRLGTGIARRSAGRHFPAKRRAGCGYARRGIPPSGRGSCVG